MLNSDYKDILRALFDQKVKFILIGAYAIAVHGYPRTTMDIDFWVLPDHSFSHQSDLPYSHIIIPLANIKSLLK
jgi:hypothetical protein